MLPQQEQDINALTGLFDHPGFQTLVRFYRQKLELIEDKMQNTSDPRIFMELGRVWQAVRMFVKSLEADPANAAEHLKHQLLAQIEEAERQGTLRFDN